GQLRQAQEAASHGGSLPDRIDEVGAEIAAGVDARDDNVRFPVQQAGQRDVHGVGRGAVHPPGVLVDPCHAHGQVQGQCIADTGTVAVRGDDDDVVPGRTETFGEDAEARGVDTIVVAD